MGVEMTTLGKSKPVVAMERTPTKTPNLMRFPSVPALAYLGSIFGLL